MKIQTELLPEFKSSLGRYDLCSAQARDPQMTETFRVRLCTFVYGYYENYILDNRFPQVYLKPRVET